MPAILALVRLNENNAGVQPELTIVGSSARAAAYSAARSGFLVHAGDLFADADLCRVADVTQVVDYPAGLGRVIDGVQSGSWLYTGALENHPRLVDDWACRRPLLGNDGAVLRAVRDPHRLLSTLTRHGLRFPSFTRDSTGIPPDGSWLSKPIRSAGGIGIQRWRGGRHASRRACYFQEYIPGTPHSGVYVADGRSAILLGVTEQLIGCRWAGASSFRYCGSLGPVQLGPLVTEQFLRIGQSLTAEFSLRGLFGVDAIINARGVWVVEVNPRYTASVEILERSFDLPGIALHIAACREGALPNLSDRPEVKFCGKAVLFAPRRLELAESWSTCFEAVECDGWPTLADIPRGQMTVECGWPIATVFAVGSNSRAVLEALRDRATLLRALCQAG